MCHLGTRHGRVMLPGCTLSPRQIYPQKSLCVLYCLRSTAQNGVCVAGIGLEKVGPGVSLSSLPWLKQSVSLGSNSLCVGIPWLEGRKDAQMRQRELGVTVAMAPDFAENIASWLSRRKVLGSGWQMTQGQLIQDKDISALLCLFCFSSSPSHPWDSMGRRLFLVPSLSLNSSLAKCLSPSILPSILLQNLNQENGMWVPSFLFFFFLLLFRHSVHMRAYT